MIRTTACSKRGPSLIYADETGDARNWLRFLGDGTVETVEAFPPEHPARGFGVRMAIRLPDKSVLFITCNRHGGLIPNREGERVEVVMQPGRVIRVGRYTFSEREATALASCLLSTIFAMKEPEDGRG